MMIFTLPPQGSCQSLHMSVVVMKHVFRPVTFHVENLKKILPGVVPVKKRS